MANLFELVPINVIGPISQHLDITEAAAAAWASDVDYLSFAWEHCDSVSGAEDVVHASGYLGGIADARDMTRRQVIDLFTRLDKQSVDRAAEDLAELTSEDWLEKYGDVATRAVCGHCGYSGEGMTSDTLRCPSCGGEAIEGDCADPNCEACRRMAEDSERD